MMAIPTWFKIDGMVLDLNDVRRVTFVEKTKDNPHKIIFHAYSGNMDDVIEGELALNAWELFQTFLIDSSAAYGSRGYRYESKSKDA